VTDRIHDALRARARDRGGRDPMASAGMVDAQAVKGADTVGTDTRGWDGAKRVDGRKRHLVTDTLGLLVVVFVTAGSVQDRDGGRRVLARAKTAMPSMVVVWADGGYAGKPGLLGRHALPHRTGYRSENQRAAWVCCPTAPLGDRMDAVVAGALSPPRPRL
jgi:transposase